jgi:hypothetical protein
VSYQKLGCKLGIGTRVAAKMLRERTQTAQAVPAPRPAAASRTQSATAKASSPQAREIGRRAARGSAGFTRAVWTPFRRAAGTLWHQVTGVFFAIFALFFAQNAWRMRSAWRAGEEHRHFLIYLLLLLVFAYFSATAFWNGRAAAHTKKGRV